MSLTWLPTKGMDRHARQVAYVDPFSCHRTHPIARQDCDFLEKVIVDDRLSLFQIQKRTSVLHVTEHASLNFSASPSWIKLLIFCKGQ